MSPASKGAAARKKDSRSSTAFLPSKGAAGGKPAASVSPGAQASGKTDETGLSSVTAPRLPPFWVEWQRALADKWPIPVFVLAAIAGVAVFLARPKAEPVRGPEEHVQIARKAFDMAAAAQDEREDLSKAIDFLAGRNVEELARELGIPDPHGVHGVLPSYERAQESGAGSRLKAEDLAMAGEACYRLAEIKREHPDGIGRRILKPADELYRRAIADLSAACGMVPRNAGAEWYVRRRLIAESKAQLKQYAAALGELQTLIEAMTADQAERLRQEKDPLGAGQLAADRSAKEWARVYDLAGRCYDQSGRSDQAENYYRLLLSLGESGSAVQRVRLRLAELVMDDNSGERALSKDPGKVRAGIEEACQLCAQVERSDAPAALREKAGFMLGQGCYRLGTLESDPAKARAHFAAAAQAFRYPYSAGGPHLEMSRVLLARSLFLAGGREEAREQLKGVLRMGVQPAIYACAEVCMADVLMDSEPARALNGDALHGSGYLGVVQHIRKLPAGAVEQLVPELTALLADAHFATDDPDPRRPLPPGGGQLLRMARDYAAEHNYDEAVRIYRHIVDNYTQIEVDRYRFLLGELLAEKVEWLAGHGRPEKETRPVLVVAAREFMRVSEKSRNLSEAWWRAGRCYFAAQRYDGASLAFGKFAGKAANDNRVAEALYYQGEALRRMGSREAAIKAFGKGAEEHADSQFGYLAQLALGEACLEMDRLEAGPEEKEPDAKRNALAVFESIRRDARYTPESQVWMKALFHLGETHFRLGHQYSIRATEQGLAAREADAKTAKDLEVKAAGSKAKARKHLEDAARTLEEASERYPLAKQKGDRPSFQQFLRARQLPVMRMQAMIQLDLERFDRAAALFGEIIRVTAEVGDLDRTEADQCRREAFTYKGIAEIRGGHPDVAAETFLKAHDEFGRAPEGPWFAHARWLALDLAGQSERAEEWRTKAVDGYAEQIKIRSQAGSAQQPKGAAAVQEWILPPEEWREHARWAGKSNG